MSFINNFCNTDFSDYKDFYDNFKLNIPQNFNFAYDVLDKLAEKNKDKNALLWVSKNGEEKNITFFEMKEQSDKYALAMSKLGIKKGDKVFVSLRNRYEYWFVSLALHKIGAVLIPSTHTLSEEELAFRINKSEAKMIILSECSKLFDVLDNVINKDLASVSIKATVEFEKDSYLDLKMLASVQTGEYKQTEKPSDNDIMIAYFTSGTKEKSKLVLHNYLYPLSHILTAKFWQNLSADDLHFSIADSGWAKTSWGKMYGQWICEACVFVYDGQAECEPKEYLDLIEKYKITSFCAPPSVYRFLSKEALINYSFKSLKSCTVSGEPLNPDVYNRWLKSTNVPIREGYGQTECNLLVMNDIWDKTKPGSMGLSLPLSKIKIMDDFGNECELGEEGEICVEAKEGNYPLGLFTGYYKDDELLQKVMEFGYYHTGDMAWKDEEGYIWFKGRSEDMIRSSGYKIAPFEVESTLIEHPAVLEAAVTAFPDSQRGFSVKATVVLAKGFKPSDELVKQLQDYVKKAASPYKHPRILEFVEELPKTINGKISRAKIRTSDLINNK